MPFPSVTRFSSHRVSQPRRSNSFGSAFGGVMPLNGQVSVVRPRRDSSRQQLADLTVGWIPTTLSLFVLSRCLGVDWSKTARS